MGNIQTQYRKTVSGSDSLSRGKVPPGLIKYKNIQQQNVASSEANIKGDEKVAKRETGGWGEGGGVGVRNKTSRPTKLEVVLCIMNIYIKKEQSHGSTKETKR